MKIVFTTDTINRGGKERQLMLLVYLLLKKGYSVSIITKQFSGINYFNEYGLNNNIVKVISGDSVIKKFRSFKEFIFSEKPEILISFDLQTALFALILYKQFNFIFINASIQHGIRLFRFSHLVRSLVCWLSPYVIANSFAGLKANNLSQGKNKFVLYNGIEDKFRNTLSAQEIKNMREKLVPGYSLTPGPIFVSVANFVPYKDYFTVLKSLSNYRREKPFYYFIIGSGPLAGEINSLIDKYKLRENIFLTGAIENVSPYLFISDMMIHSSRGEGISNSILEGMYSGLPVIATNVGGIPETVFPGSSLLFPYKDDKELLNCLIKAPEAFKDFNPQSEEYRKHLQKFSVETMLNRFEEIISVVSQGRNSG
jgi:glycosyltransferase involved in cell wall biosynthesis